MTKAEILKLLEKYGDDAEIDFNQFTSSSEPETKVEEKVEVEPEAEAEAEPGNDDEKLDLIAKDIYQTLKESDTPEANGLAKLFSLADIRSKMDKNADWDDNRTIDAFYDDLMEQARGRWHELEETKEEAPYPVYTTTDDSMLAWKDPAAFKKFVIGPLIWGLNKEDREAALKDYWKMSPEDLINNDKLTGGSFTMFMSNDKDNGGAISFDEGKDDYYWDTSLRDLYNSGDDTDPFDADLYDLLDNFNGDIEDVNGDGDPDVMTEDTNGDGEADAATVTADDEAEASEAVDSAKESLDDGKKVEQDSTGSLNDKPSEDVSDEKVKNKKSSGCVSDEKVKDKKHPEDCSCAECTKKKEQELSDSRFKNIVNTLVDKLW